MEFILSCSACIAKQIAQVAEIKNIKKDKADELMKKVLIHLAKSDFTKSTPQLMGEIWDILENEIGTRDVYNEIKPISKIDIGFILFIIQLILLLVAV